MRNLKVLGLALVAVLAMSSVVASMASADSFTGETGTVVLTGSQEGNDIFTLTGGSITCKEAKLVGTSTAISSTVTITPTYPEKTVGGEQNCTALGLPGVIHANGCTYLLHIGAGTEGTLDINCPAGKELTVTAGAPPTIRCTIHIGSQAGLTKVTFSNTGSGVTRELLVETAVSTLKYSHTKGTGLGACTPGSATNGGYTGKARITGERDNGGTEHVGIFLS